MSKDRTIIRLPENDEAPHDRLDNFDGLIKWLGVGSLTLVDANRAEIIVEEGSRLYLIVVGGWVKVRVDAEAKCFCLVTGFACVQGDGDGWHCKAIYSDELPLSAEL